MRPCASAACNAESQAADMHLCFGHPASLQVFYVTCEICKSTVEACQGSKRGTQCFQTLSEISRQEVWRRLHEPCCTIRKGRGLFPAPVSAMCVRGRVAKPVILELTAAFLHRLCNCFGTDLGFASCLPAVPSDEQGSGCKSSSYPSGPQSCCADTCRRQHCP